MGTAMKTVDPNIIALPKHLPIAVWGNMSPYPTLAPRSGASPCPGPLQRLYKLQLSFTDPLRHHRQPFSDDGHVLVRCFPVQVEAETDEGQARGGEYEH
jgi:hypothetical protein